MQYTWLIFFITKEEFEKIFDYVFECKAIFIGSYMTIDGPLTLKDGRIIGKKGEILTSIATITFKKEPIEKMIEMGISNTLSTIQFTDLASEELISNKDGDNIVKKARMHKNIKTFTDYLQNIGIII